MQSSGEVGRLEVEDQPSPTPDRKRSPTLYLVKWDILLSKLGGLDLTTAKETMIDIISRQPDDSSYDALLRGIAYARMIQRGLEDVADGRTMSDVNAKNAMDSWQK